MTDLHYLSLCEASRLIRWQDITSLELTQALFERIESRDDRAYVTLAKEKALLEAEEADKEIRDGRIRGRLHGIPVGLKDLCATPGIPTCVGGLALRDWNPSGEATVAARLREAGAVTLGKLKTTEGAYAVHHPDIEPPINPWNSESWPGVSSSGSGVGTAAGLCFASLGTDTGGSIRFPSYANGVVGLKPTWGRVSRHGVFALAESLDHIGPICRTVEDAAIVLHTIAGNDRKDGTTLDAPVPNYYTELEKGGRGLRLGIDVSHCSRDVDTQIVKEIFESVEILRESGVAIKEVKIPDSSAACASWGLLCAVEAAVSHAESFPKHRDLYGPVLSELLDAGISATATEYVEAATLRAQFAGEFVKLFNEVDFVISPSMYTTNPSNTELESMIKAGEVGKLIEHTAPADLSGSPAICMPGGFDQNQVPFGFQLIGRHLSEELLLRAGYILQEARTWKNRHP